MPRDPYPTSPRRQQPSYPTPYWVPTGVPGIYNYVPFGAATPPPGTGTAAPYRPMPRGTPGGAPPTPAGGAQPPITPTAAASGYWSPYLYGRMKGWTQEMRERGFPAGWYAAGTDIGLYGSVGNLGYYNAAGEWVPATTATYYDPNYGNPATYSGYTFRRQGGKRGRGFWLPNLWEERLGRELTPEEKQDIMNPARFNPYRNELRVPKGKKGYVGAPPSTKKKAKNAGVGTTPAWTSSVAQFNI